MLDAHVHIEKGPYTADWIDAFIEQALTAGIDEIHLLEHSFRFLEFREIYQTIERHLKAGGYQKEWLASKCNRNLDEYTQLVSAMRKRNFPIKVQFGLEVCYFPENEQAIKDVTSRFEWDFITGAIHWIDGFGFDHKENLPLWPDVDVDALYRRYFKLIEMAVQSELFDVIAHPDSIKCFDFYPSYELSETYRNVAKIANNKRVKMEFNNGLTINYGHNELGLNREFLKILKGNRVQLVTASDAHRPEDVGRYIKQAEDVINGNS
jgi:histidinol-phosphatase (PHP family)